jgi:hypothetical protein
VNRSNKKSAAQSSTSSSPSSSSAHPQPQKASSPASSQSKSAKGSSPAAAPAAATFAAIAMGNSVWKVRPNSDDELSLRGAWRHDSALRLDLWKQKQDIYGEIPDQVDVDESSASWVMPDGRTEVKVQIDHVAEVQMIEYAYFEMASAGFSLAKQRRREHRLCVMDALNGWDNLNLTSQRLNGSKGQVFKNIAPLIDWKDANQKLTLAEMFADVKVCEQLRPEEKDLSAHRKRVSRKLTKAVNDHLLNFRDTVRSFEPEYPDLELFDHQLSALFQKMSVSK